MRPDALVLSILSPEQEDKPSRETKVLYWNAVATFFRPLAEARSLRTGTTALVLKVLRSDITVSVLQGSQVAPGVVNVLAGYGRDLNVYIHTYMHTYPQ
jgi:hypothetical protein